ncbi:MAG: hypothetical protein WDN45_16255 [Caulobacteraceae bacterium]
MKPQVLQGLDAKAVDLLLVEHVDGDRHALGGFVALARRHDQGVERRGLRGRSRRCVRKGLGQGALVHGQKTGGDDGRRSAGDPEGPLESSTTFPRRSQLLDRPYWQFSTKPIGRRVHQQSVAVATNPRLRPQAIRSNGWNVPLSRSGGVGCLSQFWAMVL